MWDLIVSSPDQCLSFCFNKPTYINVCTCLTNSLLLHNKTAFEWEMYRSVIFSKKKRVLFWTENRFTDYNVLLWEAIFSLGWCLKVYQTTTLNEKVGWTTECFLKVFYRKMQGIRNKCSFSSRQLPLNAYSLYPVMNDVIILVQANSFMLVKTAITQTFCLLAFSHRNDSGQPLNVACKPNVVYLWQVIEYFNMTPVHYRVRWVTLQTTFSFFFCVFLVCHDFGYQQRQFDSIHIQMPRC